MVSEQLDMHEVESDELDEGLCLPLFCRLANFLARCFDGDLTDLCLYTAKILSNIFSPQPLGCPPVAFCAEALHPW